MMGILANAQEAIRLPHPPSRSRMASCTCDYPLDRTP